MPPRRVSFWSSVPGIITAIGGLLAAVAGLITALYTTRIIGNRPEPAALSANVPPSRPVQSAESAMPALKAVLSPAAVDRSEAKPTAHAILSAYRSRDVIALAGLVNADNKRIFVELAEQGDSHPRYESIFGDENWRARAARAWDGNLGEVRYRHIVGTAINEYEAQVKFGYGEGAIAVVSLTWENGRWSWEDIHRASPDTFLKGRTTFSLADDPY